jgi:hypothetical protein
LGDGLTEVLQRIQHSHWQRKEINNSRARISHESFLGFDAVTVFLNMNEIFALFREHHFLRAAVSCVETALPSFLHVSIIWFSCELGSLIWGIGACTLRAQWTSTSAVRRLRSLAGE